MSTHQTYVLSHSWRRHLFGVTWCHAGECEGLAAELQEARKAGTELQGAQELLQQDLDRLQVEAAEAAAALASTRWGARAHGCARQHAVHLGSDRQLDIVDQVITAAMTPLMAAWLQG